MKEKRIQLLVGTLILSIVACSLPGGIPTTFPIDQIGTTVAGTLTAMPSLFGGVTVIPEETVVSTPEIPVEPPVPSILRVAYVKNKDAWMWTETGGTLQLTSSFDVQDARISSDGEVVAYIRQTDPFGMELWAVNSDGSNTRQLVGAADLFYSYTGPVSDKPKGVGVYQFGWQPGTHNLYYNTKPLFEGPGLMGYDDLFKVDADSLVKTTIFMADQGGKFVFSPDGQRMAIVTPTSISLANADGSNLQGNVLTYANVITYSEYLYYPNPVWAEDGSGLRIVIPPGDPMPNPDVPPSTVYYLSGDGSSVVENGNIIAIPFAWPDEAISPDLNRIGYAVAVGAPAENQRELHLANGDTTGATIYGIGTSLQFLGWLPNSTQFVYRVTSGPGTGTHVGNLDGSWITLSVDPTLISDISWPNRDHFLYRWRSGSLFELRYNQLGAAGSALIDNGEIWSYDFSN